MTIDPNPQSIAAVAERIRPHIRQTPVVEAGALVGRESGSVLLKLEQMQHAGSFKTRGAFANLLLREVPPAGVVAASGGNHGAAVAYAAMRRSVPATIFVPVISNPAKVQRIRDYGADLRQQGSRYADALEASELWQEQSGAMAVHAYDDEYTVAGQGTLAFELEQQCSGIDTVLAAVGGGGLIGGIAAYFSGRVRVVGVEPEASPTLAWAMREGKPVDAPAEGYAADSLAPKRVGKIPFEIARRYVDRIVLVSDDEIRAAQIALWQNLRIVAEPGGSAAFAAPLSRRYVPEANERVAVIISGGNTDAVKF